MPATHRVALVESPAAFSAVPMPIGKNLPFDWPAFALKRGAGVVLGWRNAPLRPSRLRLTIALSEREHKVVEVVSIATSEVVGTFEWYSPLFLQTLEIELDPQGGNLEGGILLRVVQGNDPVWIIGQERDQPLPRSLPTLLLPHALDLDPAVQNDPMGEFYPRLQSMACVQPFGWRTGAVWEGLWALSRLPGGGAARSVLNTQLNLFSAPGGHLEYLNAVNHKVERTPHAIEALYPLGFLGLIDPLHRTVTAALAWAESHCDFGSAHQEGDLWLRDALPAASFFAVLATRLPDRAEALAGRAYAQLEARRSALVEPDAVWSTRHADGRKHGMNRTRSLGAYGLAIARVLELLPDHGEAETWREEGRRVAQLARAAQLSDGLWSHSFDPLGFSSVEGEPETGATALLALFLVTGARHGWLQAQDRTSAARAASALRSRLTPDGFLLAGEAEVPRTRTMVIPAGGFPASAFQDGDFELPPPPEAHQTGELAPWAMGWLAAALAELS